MPGVCATQRRKSVEPILASFGPHLSSVESSTLRQETQTRQTLRSLQRIIITVSVIPVSDVGETVSCERQLAFPFWAFWNICILMKTSDHPFLLPPVTKHRLSWKTQRQKWKLFVRLMCHRQSCHHLHCHRQRHLLLMRIQTYLREITNWLQKIHQQVGHRDNRTLVRLVKQRGTHPWVLKMAHEHRCSACEESRPPALRHVTSSYENVPGAILETAMSVHG